MITQFDEKHPEFKGFSDFYNKELLPPLYEKEQERLAAFKKLRKYALLIVPTLVAGAIFFAWKVEHFMPLVFGLAFAAAVYFGMRFMFLKEIKSRTKNHLVKGVCNFVGWDFSEHVMQPCLLYTSPSPRDA